MQSVGRLLKSRRAWLLMLLGAIVAAISGMFSAATRWTPFAEGLNVAEWKSTTSKLDWPGPMPTAWNPLVSRAPDVVKCTRGIDVGWSWARVTKSWHDTTAGMLQYNVQVWGFPVPCMRQDEAADVHFAVSRYGYYNAVDRQPYRGLEVGSSRATTYPRAVIPQLPWWPGFIFNTLFWAIALAWITNTLRKSRWFTRLERGQCVKCKYQMNALPACPECGTLSPIQIANSQPKP
jgi:hypothetical protein